MVMTNLHTNDTRDIDCFMEMSLSYSIFSRRVIDTSCSSLQNELKISIHNESETGLRLRIAPIHAGITNEQALRVFRRELIVASVNQQARRDDMEIQGLLSSSADSITTDHLRALNENYLAGAEMTALSNPSNEKTIPPFARSEVMKEGHLSTIEAGGEVSVSLDARRFLLPVVLACAKAHQNRATIVVEALEDCIINVKLKPRPGMELSAVVEAFMGLARGWELPLVPPGKPRFVNPLDPLDPALERAFTIPGHPARPGSGLPITYFRTTYFQWEGTASPYRLGEIFSHALSPSTFLVSTRHRSWAILTGDEFRRLLELRIHEDEATFQILEALGIILTPRNLLLIAKLHAERFLYMHAPPELFIMIPTNRCNLGCTYCHAEAGQASDLSMDMTEDMAKKAMDFFLSVPTIGSPETFHVEFQGGECLLRWDLIKKAMDYANEKATIKGLQATFTICTNLTVMTDEIAEEIRTRGNIEISSSLDGPSKIHDCQRSTPSGHGTYKQVSGWHKRLKETYSLRSGFIPTLTRNVIGHETKLIDEYRKQKISHLYLRYVHRVGRAFNTTFDSLSFAPDEYVSLWRKSLSYIINLNLRGELFVERKTMSLLGNILSRHWSYMCLRRPCGMGLHQVVIDEKGDLFGCDQARSNSMLCMGNIVSTTYDEAYTSSIPRILRTMASELFPKCRHCAFSSFCGYCVARGLRQHGNPLPKMPEDFECSINLKIISEIFRDISNPEIAMTYNRWIQNEKGAAK